MLRRCNRQSAIRWSRDVRTLERTADAALVVAFLNTYDTETATRLDRRPGVVGRRGSATQDLPPAGPLATGATVRDGLRARSPSGDAAAAELRCPSRPGSSTARPRTVPLDAAGAILLAAVRLADEADLVAV